MNETTQKYLYIVGIPLILLALFIAAWFGWGWWQESQKPTAPTPFSFTVDAASQPSLEKEVVIPEGFPGDAATIARNRIKELRAAIDGNSADYVSWMDLAILYKTISDYEGAREVWEYVKKAAPMDSVAFQNLGGLYDLYLKDYPKAEENYLRAVEISPNQAGVYLGLHELYRYSYKTDSSAAVDILKKGIKATGSPVNFDLRVMLAGYYKEKGDKKNAILYYTEAKEQAIDLNNQSLIDQMEREIGALQQ